MCTSDTCKIHNVSMTCEQTQGILSTCGVYMEIDMLRSINTHADDNIWNVRMT